MDRLLRDVIATEGLADWCTAAQGLHGHRSREVLG